MMERKMRKRKKKNKDGNKFIDKGTKTQKILINIQKIIKHKLFKRLQLLVIKNLWKKMIN